MDGVAVVAAAEGAALATVDTGVALATVGAGIAVADVAAVLATVGAGAALATAGDGCAGDDDGATVEIACAPADGAAADGVAVAVACTTGGFDPAVGAADVVGAAVVACSTGGFGECPTTTSILQELTGLGSITCTADTTSRNAGLMGASAAEKTLPAAVQKSLFAWMLRISELLARRVLNP